MSPPLTLSVQEADPLPVYQQIRNQLEAYILEGDLAEGTQLPDVRTLSEKAGVSYATVDRALRELIDAGVCFRRPKKGTFVGKRTSRARRRQLCGVYVASGTDRLHSNWLVANLYRGIQECTGDASGLDTVMIGGDIDSTIDFYAGSREMKLSGVLVLDDNDLDELTRLARAYPSVRFVMLNYYHHGFEETPENVFGVFNDDFTAGYQMTDYLASHGHRRIHALGIPLSDDNYTLRLAGYRQAMADRQLVADDSTVHVLPFDKKRNQVDMAREFAPRLFSGDQAPTAVFCVNDLLAGGLVQYLAEQGRQDEVEVVGNDNSPHLSLHYRFNTMAVDYPGMGHRAMEFLTRPIEACPKMLKIVPQMMVRRRVP